DSLVRLRQSMKPEDKKLFEQLVEVARQESVLTQGPDARAPEAYRKHLDETSAKREMLETELAKRSAEFSQEVATITLISVQQAIPRDAVLLEWFRYQPFDPKAKDERARWGKPRYVAYVLKQDGEPIVVDVGEAEAIENRVQAFWKALRNRKSTFVKDVAKQLSEKLLEPLRPHLGNTQRLLLSPDG